MNKSSISRFVELVFNSEEKLTDKAWLEAAMTKFQAHKNNGGAHWFQSIKTYQTTQLSIFLCSVGWKPILKPKGEGIAFAYSRITNLSEQFESIKMTVVSADNDKISAVTIFKTLFKALENNSIEDALDYTLEEYGY